MTEEELQQEIQDAADFLIEHCEGVLILASTMDPDSKMTNLYHSYRGGYHIALGMMEHYRVLRLADKLKTDLSSEEGE